MSEKKEQSNNITGVFLDADIERMIKVNLPVVKTTKTIEFDGKELSKDSFLHGEFAFMGDFHYGNECFSKSVVHGYLQYLKEHPNIRMGLMGDILEYGEGRRFIKEDDRVPIDDQISMFTSDFKQFNDRIDFILWGNHEEKFIEHSSSKRLMKDIARELGVDLDKCYVGEPQRGVFITFIAGDKIYGAYAQHSKTNARINQEIQLARAGSQNIVSLIVHGHTHGLAFKPRTFRVLEMVNGKLANVVRRQYLCVTGCALKYPSYAEAGSYPYTEVGFPIVKFYADHNEIDEYDLTNRYRPYLERGNLFAPSNEKVHLELDIITCPKCKESTIQKRGIITNKTHRIQRYSCMTCGKSFSVLVKEE
jgi:UDP-2,3-diacylglucosamine pyrophosphatase LpxH